MKELILKLKDPGSALTHGIGMIAALIASVPLIGKAASDLTAEKTAAMAIFIISMILLYGASTIYHSLNISPRVNKVLRKVDHMMIYVLIAGTYTPVCAIVLGTVPAGSCFWPSGPLPQQGSWWRPSGSTVPRPFPP